MWKTRKSRHNRYSAVFMAALSFLLPVFIMLVSYNASGIYPFGDEQFSYMDFYHLYLPFFKEFVRDTRAGKGIFYSWNAGLGTNLYLLYATNLSSPFHLWGLVVPETHICDFLAYLVVFKTGLCGLCAYLFLYHRRFSRVQGTENTNLQGTALQGAALFFSMGYAMCGFLMAYNWNIMWLDCVILFPIVLWGLERLVVDGKPFLYALALAASIWCNFYLSIMICMFLVLYLCYLLWAGEDVAGRRRGILRDFTVFSLLAGGIAAVLLMPAVLALFTSDFGAGQTVVERGNYFTVPAVLIRHCMAVKPVHMYNHWPNIYCGVIAFLLVPLYIFSKNIPWRRRIGMLALAGTVLLGFINPVLDLIWHGMNYPDGLPARQSYIYSMVVLLMCFECMTNLDFEDKRQRKSLIFVYFADVVFFLLVSIFETESGVEISDLILSFVFITIYMILLCLAYLLHGKQERGCLLFVAMTVMILETQINTVETNVVSSKWGEPLDPAVCHSLYEQVAVEEQGIFRMEMFARESFNEGVRDDYPSASVFASTKNSAIRLLYERLGMRGGKVFYSFEGNTPLTAAILNVKYMFGQEDGYAGGLYTLDRKEGDICLYKVNAALPFGYVAPPGYDLTDTDEGLSLQNQLVRRLGIEDDLFEKCSAEEQDGVVLYTAPADGFYYAVLTCDQVKKVLLTGPNVGGWGWNTQYLQRNSVIYLGEMTAGQTGSIKKQSTDEENEGKLTAEVYRLNEDVLAKAVEKLSEQHLENVTFDNTHINGDLHMERSGRLILSVPYEKGWSIRLNGRRVTPETFGGALIALDLEAGDYRLEMRYEPYGFSTGLLISALSIAMTVVIWFGRKRENKFSELSNEL